MGGNAHWEEPPIRVIGFGMLWLTLLTSPLMWAVQQICDRTALATGNNLGELQAERFATRARRG